MIWSLTDLITTWGELVPDPDTTTNQVVVYLATGKNPGLEKYIKKNFFEITSMFKEQGNSFYYIDKPILSAIKKSRGKNIQRDQLALAITRQYPNLSGKMVEELIYNIDKNINKISLIQEQGDKVNLPVIASLNCKLAHTIDFGLASKEKLEDDLYKDFFWKAIKPKYVDRPVIPDGISVIGEKGKIVRIQIGGVYILDLEPAEMAIYILLLYYGSIDSRDLNNYKSHLKKVLECAQSIRIDESKNERTIQNLTNNKKLLGETISRINGKIQRIFYMTPELYRLYQINTFDTLESVKLIVDIDKKTFPNFITAYFKAFDA